MKRWIITLILTLASLPVHPESVPINMLVKVEGTPLANQAKLDPLDFVRTIAVARICMRSSRKPPGTALSLMRMTSSIRWNSRTWSPST